MELTELQSKIAAFLPQVNEDGTNFSRAGQGYCEDSIYAYDHRDPLGFLPVNVQLVKANNRVYVQAIYSCFDRPVILNLFKPDPQPGDNIRSYLCLKVDLLKMEEIPNMYLASKGKPINLSYSSISYIKNPDVAMRVLIAHDSVKREGEVLYHPKKPDSIKLTYINNILSLFHENQRIHSCELEHTMFGDSNEFCTLSRALAYKAFSHSRDYYGISTFSWQIVPDVWSDFYIQTHVCDSKRDRVVNKHTEQYITFEETPEMADLMIAQFEFERYPEKWMQIARKPLHPTNNKLVELSSGKIYENGDLIATAKPEDLLCLSRSISDTVERACRKS